MSRGETTKPTKPTKPTTQEEAQKQWDRRMSSWMAVPTIIREPEVFGETIEHRSGVHYLDTSTVGGFAFIRTEEGWERFNGARLRLDLRSGNTVHLAVCMDAVGTVEMMLRERFLPSFTAVDIAIDDTRCHDLERTTPIGEAGPWKCKHCGKLDRDPNLACKDRYPEFSDE